MRHPADIYTFDNGETLRLLNDHIIIQTDSDEKETAGGLIKPDGALEHIYKTGTVLAFGYVKDRPKADTAERKPLPEPIPIPDIEVGVRCCFIRFREMQDSNKRLRIMFGDNIIALKPEDILFVFTGDVELG